MGERITNFILIIRRLPIFRIFQRTLGMLMPIAIIGSYFKLLRDAVFSPDSFIYNILNFDSTMSDKIWYAGSFICNGFVRVTFGLFGLYAAYFAARYTARLYHKDSTLAGMTAVMIIMFCAYASNVGNKLSNKSMFSSSVLQINALLLALLVGYAVGEIFHWLGKNHQPVEFEHVHRVRTRAWNALLPASVSIIAGMILGIIIYELQIKILSSSTFKELVIQIQNSNNIFEIIALAFVVMLLSWIGIGYPLASLSTAAALTSGTATVNLNYALKHGGSWNVPYKFLGSSLVYPYGAMGGASVVLALIVIILLSHQNKETENIAKANLLPAAFNSTWGFMIGLPIILNPVLFLPMVLIPVINIMIASLAIFLHIITPCVYPVLKGTPGILISFFGSNGNWSNLVFSICLFILDILMLIPISLLGQRIERKLKAYEYEKGQQTA
ncbi:PTS transporter subunit EIIC [Lactobacillus gallinarum]|uniref:PTS transporter subunit EIIC n=1 Tax=Lactobacillus gallinarum TaxID=52242 RepID=UPI0024B24BA6|nr:PTS transporter subunit EIIC [Lactobacillus gallinarum]